MIKYLVQDIETVPETELANDWATERAELEAAGKKDPFPPLVYHRVITIGMLTLDEDLLPVRAGCAAGGVVGGKSERAMIERWSSVAAGDGRNPIRLVDWYGRGFDVPVLQNRAFRYGIQLPWYFGLQADNRGEKSQWSKEYRDRYAGAHDDLADIWTNRGAFAKPHMADLAKLMGLPGKVAGDGGKVHDLWKSYSHARKVEGIDLSLRLALEIDTYCMQDVFQTALILQRFHYLSARINLDGYRVAARALLDMIEQADPLLFKYIDTQAVLLQDV